VLVGRVTAAPTVGGKSVIGRAEVGGRDDDGSARDAPAQVVHAPQLKARAADLPALEERLAQPHCGHAVPGLLKVPEAARPAHRVPGVRRRVEGGACGLPLGERR
jgi:hypothetical protein